MEEKRYLKIFNTQEEYEAQKDEVMGVPHVVLLEDNKEVVYASETQEEEKDYSKEYFTIEALEDKLNIKLSQNASEYRIDDSEWVTLESDTVTPSINNGQKISFKITHPTISSYHPFFGIGTFTINKKCNVSGNIMSLLYGDNFEGQTDLSGKNFAFARLFNNCTTLQSAENLVLPATILAECCYQDMFQGCTSLTTAPQLIATTLADSCYSYMFYKCENLTTALELPATTLAYGCYSHMLEGCTSLTVAPELLATTLADSCYENMFQNCTSLTTAPELHATTLAGYCYWQMFDGCIKLNYIKMLATDISARECLTSWVNRVASSGTFVKSAAMTSLESGIHGIPNGWTVENS